MLYVLALASAALYGAADFLGGFASRRTSTIAVVVISQCAGLVALGLLFPFLPASSPVRGDVMWGAAAGLAGGIGVALLYRALAIGSMAVVAPITAVCAVTIPVAVAIALGERPGMGPTAGIALAILAIVLVSQQTQAEPSGLVAQGFSPVARSSGVGLALASGVAIGLFFLALARTRADAGMWPLVAARCMSFVLFATVALVTRRSVRMPSNVAAIAVAGGVLDMLANLLYLLASRYGPLSIVVTLSSLYPASTVLLARTVLGDRLSALQAAGIACALVAVLLIVGTR
jgi:drug/metabolite transporter (DMT)-like permease